LRRNFARKKEPDEQVTPKRANIFVRADRAVASVLDDAAVMGGDGRVDQIAAKTPKARASVLVGGEPAVADRNGSTLIHLSREERPLRGAFLPFPDRAGKAAKGRFRLSYRPMGGRQAYD
jgi:hypothetical protein